jgi:hypothetical protein
MNVNADNEAYSLLTPLQPIKQLAADLRLPQHLLSIFLSRVMLNRSWEDSMESQQS